MARRGDKSGVELLEVHVTEEQLELLRKLDFPGTEEILAKPIVGEEGLFVRMSRMALEDFVGWVAGEANHERKKRRAEMLNDIADEMESALVTGPLLRS
jgi:hypothetical protein